MQQVKTIIKQTGPGGLLGRWDFKLPMINPIAFILAKGQSENLESPEIRIDFPSFINYTD